MKSITFLLIILSFSGCTFFGFGHHTVSGLICKENFEIGEQCTVFDPILRQQVPIDPSNVWTICTAINDKQQRCAYTYTDSMNDTWSSEPFIERE